jgi:cytochrome c biogenesis protein CcmG, thiol:disulfide interchange protein DsbE
MKKYLLPAIFACSAALLSAQATEQPAVPYPFRATLYRPDSSAVASEKVLASGKPTVLAFWLTTCMPCMSEFEAYSKKYAEWMASGDFQLIGISIDFPNRFHQIAPMVAEKKWPFPVYWDRERTFKQVLPGGLNGLPQVFVFNRKGALVWQHKGYRPGFEDELWSKVQELAR